MRKLVSRVAFCQQCYDKGRPQDGDMFVVYGGDSKQTWTYMFEGKEKRSECPFLGFTPHFFTVDKLLPNGNFSIIMCCGMEDCGIYFTYDEAGKKNGFKTLKASVIEMTKVEWESLVNFSDTGYEL